MKVRGRSGDVTPEDYAREVADRWAERLVLALEQGHVDVLPAPEEFADSYGEIVAYVPDESPNELAELLAPFWTSGKVRDALSIGTRQALDSRRRNGSILGLKSADGDVFYPVCQFQRRDDGRVEVKPGLVALFRALRHFDPWTVGVLLHTPVPELGTLTPLDWVRRGMPDEALEDLGHAVAREWSAGAA